VLLPDEEDIQVVNRIKPTIPPEWYKHYPENPKYISPLASFGEGYRFHVTGLAHDSQGFPTTRPNEVARMMDNLRNKVIQNIDDIVQIESFMMEDAKIAIFAAGITARSAKAAVLEARKHGKKVGLLRPLTIWPFPDGAIKKYLADVKGVIVPELNQGQLSLEIKRVLGHRKTRKIIEVQKNTGELITPDEILQAIKEVQ